jgi:hypothetical protein
MNYKPEVKVEGNWCHNSLVFATKEEAEASAKALMGRWMLVQDSRAVETKEDVNSKWVGSKFVSVDAWSRSEPMSEETLHTAARRAVRDFNIDMNKGGIITVHTQQSMETLSQQVEKETKRQKHTPTMVVEMKQWPLKFMADQLASALMQKGERMIAIHSIFGLTTWIWRKSHDHRA